MSVLRFSMCVSTAEWSSESHSDTSAASKTSSAEAKAPNQPVFRVKLCKNRSAPQKARGDQSNTYQQSQNQKWKTAAQIQQGLRSLTASPLFLSLLCHFSAQLTAPVPPPVWKWKAGLTSRSSPPPRRWVPVSERGCQSWRLCLISAPPSHVHVVSCSQNELP